jgi:putative component of membrane protein insertase Oxa1/YidC/SpoIIIJ protein YidD
MFRWFISILVNPRCKHDIFTVFIILKSTCFHDETVDGIHNVNSFCFQIDIFLDSDFSTLIGNRNPFQFSEDFCAKSSCKLTCLKQREISIMVIPLLIIFRWFISILVNHRCKHDIFTVFIILKSTCFHDETVDGIYNVIDIVNIIRKL